MSEEVYVSKPTVSERISFIAAMTFSSSLVPSKEIVSSAAESTKCAGELSNVTPGHVLERLDLLRSGHSARS